MRQREHQVLAFEHGAAAARDVAAERLDVLVEVVRPVDARRQRIVRVQLVIEFSEELIRANVVGHVSRLDREAGAAQDRGGRAEVLPEKRDVVRVVDRHEVVRGDVEPLERQEVERAIPLQRAAEGGAVLLLRVRGLRAIDLLTRRIETLEVILRIQRAVAKKEEQIAAPSCSCRSWSRC